MQTERAEIEFALKLYIKMLPEAICKAVIHSSSSIQLSFETNVLQLAFFPGFQHSPISYYGGVHKQRHFKIEVLANPIEYLEHWFHSLSENGCSKILEFKICVKMISLPNYNLISCFSKHFMEN